MMKEEFYTACKTVEGILGRQSSWLVPEMTKEDRIRVRNMWDALAEELLDIAEKYPSEAAEMTVIADKYSVSGTTPKFYRWSYYRTANALYVDEKLVLCGVPAPQIYEYILTH